MLDQQFRSSDRQDLRATQPEPRILSFADLWRFVRLRRVSILVPILAFLAMAYGYTLVALPTYSARAQIIIDPRLPQFIPGHTEETVLAWDSAQVESEIAVLLSERIAGEVVTKLGLDRDKDFRRSLPMIGRIQTLVGFAPSPPAEVKPDRFREALALIQDGLSVRRTGLSYAIDISFAYPEAFRTSEIANALAEAYIADQLENRSQAARLGGEWLQGRMVQLRAQMNAASKAVQVFRASHNYTIARPGSASAPAEAAAPGQPPAVRPDEITLDELDASASTYRKIYESFLQSYTESVQRQSFPVSDARILTPASQPKTRSAPRGTLIYALALLLGSLAGLGVAILRNHLDRAIRGPWQMSALCPFDDLGTLPLVRRRPLKSTLSGIRDLILGRSPPPQSPRERLKRSLGVRRRLHRWRSIHFLASLARPPSSFSQAMTSIRTLISLSSRQSPLRCIGITAAEGGAGASAVASNLASLAAACGTRILLIDADASHRTLTRRVGLGDRPGLRDVLVEHALLDRAIIPFPSTGLDFLAASMSDPFTFSEGPARKLDALLELLATRYDLVIFDLAPLYPLGESLEFCAVLDGVVLVVEAGRTQAPAVIASAACLARVHAQTLGFVLNKVST